MTWNEFFKGKYNTHGSGCLLWNMCKFKAGYGCTGRNTYAHRKSYELFYGPIPEGSWVLHRCDVRSCINPKHLFLGDAKANNDDMFNKGRRKTRAGIRDRIRKLTDSDQDKIRNLYSTGNTQRQLAKEYSTTQSEIWRIIHREHATQLPRGKVDTSPIKTVSYP
jgi:hypothetical protein